MSLHVRALGVALSIVACGGSQPPPSANDLLAIEATARAACAVLELERARVPLPPRVADFCVRLGRASALTPLPEEPKGAGGSP